MMDEIDFNTLQEEIEARKCALGLVAEDDERYRNSGLRRLPEKRAFLERIAERCKEAGVLPLKAHY